MKLSIHAIHPVGPNNANRDDSGSPKSITYAGTRRQVWSSQSVKSAMRKTFRASGIATGTRTRKVADLVAAAVTARGGTADENRIRQVIAYAFGLSTRDDAKDVMAFVSGTEADALAQVVLDDNLPLPTPDTDEEAAARAKTAAKRTAAEKKIVKSKDDADKPLIKALKDAIAEKMNNAVLDLDIRLFGRMMAGEKDLNVDAAAQVAPAISATEFVTEFDFWTAVDDLDTGTGAGGMGDAEYGTSVMYRYANLDLEKFTPVECVDVARVFVHAFVTSMPGGKQNSYANTGLPAYVRVTVGDVTMNAVDAFSTPATDTSSAISKLYETSLNYEETYGIFYDIDASFNVDTDGSFREVLDALDGIDDLYVPGTEAA